LTRLKWLLCW